MFATVTAIDRGAGPQPSEVFVRVGKAGADTAAVAEALGRLLSLLLRLPSAVPAGARLREAAEQLAGIGGPGRLGADLARSLPEALGRVLLEALPGSLPTAPSGVAAARTPPWVAADGRDGRGPTGGTGERASPPTGEAKAAPR
jgi:hypothetical protein